MTAETTQEAPARYRTKSEAVTAIQITEDNGPAVLAFCGIPDVPGLKATINALPGENGNRMPVSLRPGDWIVKHGTVPHEHFSVHGPTAFGMAYESAIDADEAEMEHFARDASLLAGARIISHTLDRLARTMEAARIEMQRSGPEKAMQWILGASEWPEDDGQGLAWDGKETARAWFDRVMAAEKAEARS